VKRHVISSLRRGEIGSSVFRNVTQRRLVAIYGRFGKNYGSHPHGPSRPQEFLLNCLALQDGKDRFIRNVGKITTNVHYVTSQKHEYLSAILPVTHFTLNGPELNLCIRVARPKTNLTSPAMARTSMNSLFSKSAKLSYMCKYCTLHHHL